MVSDVSAQKENGRKLYTQQRYLFMALDPIHIGAGGYRLGRVDMTIAREPGTQLPKIPGTSLAGATRSYAAMRYGKPDVAGQQKTFIKNNGHLKEIGQCPIIYTFGTATDASSQEPSGGAAQGGPRNQAGTVSIHDAHILFFPVSSMAGPVWVSTPQRIKEAWGEDSVTLSASSKLDDDTVVTSMDWKNKELNLGWLLFTVTKGLQITPPQEIKGWDYISDRIVLVTDKLFSQIVNSNLEVRTSVSISSETGAAEQGALFTYEAIPRATWLWCDVIQDDYRGKFPKTDHQCKVDKENKTYEDNQGDSLGETWSSPLDVVQAGAKLIEYLGVGGMGTRGFGRMRLVANWGCGQNI